MPLAAIDHTALFRESLAKIVREPASSSTISSFMRSVPACGLSQPVQIVICTFYSRSVPVLALSSWLPGISIICT